MPSSLFFIISSAIRTSSIFRSRGLLRQPLAKLISTTRAKHVAHHYAEIGGKSPILEFTLRQLPKRWRWICAAISTRAWCWPCATGSRLPAKPLAQSERHAPDEIVLLPLYPQYSRTTTGSSLNEWNRLWKRSDPPVTAIREFYEDAAYLDAVAEMVNRSLAQFADPADVDMIFSAHSVPVAVVQKGDPYQRQIERTVDLVWQRGGWPGRRHLCYQSKVGASKWLTPSMHETVKRMAAEGRKHLLVVPISFVSDHVETLHEIDIEHREQAHALGIADFRMAPGLNDSPSFIRALGGLVRAHAGLGACSPRGYA